MLEALRCPDFSRANGFVRWFAPAPGDRTYLRCGQFTVRQKVTILLSYHQSFTHYNA
jgi:hypothetical protein